jgi:hypothetical protein
MDAPDPAAAPAPPRPTLMLAGRRNFVLSAIYVVFWLLPVAQQGFTCRLINGLPKYLNDLYRVSCLFTDRVPSWSNYYLQVRLRGEMEWRDVPMEDYSSMPPFGHRTRISHLITESPARSNGEIIRQELADFIKARYELLHPMDPQVAGVRYIRARYSVGEPIIARPAGYWKVWPLETVEEWRRQIVFTRSFEGDGTVPPGVDFQPDGSLDR